MNMLARIAPALLLLVLAPFIAEFLLGDFSIRQIALLVALLPQYGGGALLIREVTRRTGRGWPTIVTLGLAYSLIEEGLNTQSLFNPNYVGAHLLDYGFIPALGTSLLWTVFVLSIHVVWSICTPILIAEGMAGSRRTTPWLGWIGLTVAALLYVIGCVFTTLYSLKAFPFVASPMQFASVGVLAIAAIVGAFALFRPAATSQSQDVQASSASAPAIWAVAVASLVLASGLHLSRFATQRFTLPATMGVVAMLALEVLAIVLIASWSRRRGWQANHYLALATGTVLTYAWFGLTQFLMGQTNLGTPTTITDDVGQVLEIAVVLALIASAAGWWRGARAP